MHLALQNPETINRLVEQGEFLLKTGWLADFFRSQCPDWGSVAMEGPSTPATYAAVGRRQSANCRNIPISSVPVKSVPL